MKSRGEQWSLTPVELRKLRGLKTPYGIQRALDAMPYHLADSAWSPRRVLLENTSHCYEGALFAAAALRVLGYPPLILDLEAEHDTDHVIAVYRVDGHWGALAKSNYTGCRYREPVYRSLRELALSYFDTYFNLRGERTLRTFSRPVNMRRFASLDDFRGASVVCGRISADHLSLSTDHPCPGQKASPVGRKVVPGGVSGTSRETGVKTTRNERLGGDVSLAAFRAPIMSY